MARIVVGVDASPGAGGCDDPPESLGLAGFIERLGLERTNVAGLSFGGILALELCRRLPGRLVLVSAYAGWGARRPPRSPPSAYARPSPWPAHRRGPLHASIPGSRRVVLPDAGHVCDIEVPEDFNDALRGFLRD
jgi:pimeloyl-ACP methyl ester carboxylesterase